MLRIAALVATIDAQKAALAEAEESKKNAGAHRLKLEKKIRTLEDAVKFRDKAAKRMIIVRRDEAKKLTESLATAETSKSQAQIAWEQHEKMSDQLKEVQEDLAKVKEAHAMPLTSRPRKRAKMQPKVMLAQEEDAAQQKDKADAIAPETPLHVMQAVGIQLGIDPSKLTKEKLMVTPSAGAGPAASDK